MPMAAVVPCGRPSLSLYAPPLLLLCPSYALPMLFLCSSSTLPMLLLCSSYALLVKRLLSSYALPTRCSMIAHARLCPHVPFYALPHGPSYAAIPGLMVSMPFLMASLRLLDSMPFLIPRPMPFLMARLCPSSWPVLCPSHSLVYTCPMGLLTSMPALCPWPCLTFVGTARGRGAGGGAVPSACARGHCRAVRRPGAAACRPAREPGRRRGQVRRLDTARLRGRRHPLRAAQRRQDRPRGRPPRRQHGPERPRHHHLLPGLWSVAPSSLARPPARPFPRPPAHS